MLDEHQAAPVGVSDPLHRARPDDDQLRYSVTLDNRAEATRGRVGVMPGRDHSTCASVDRETVVKRVLEAARGCLSMELAWMSEVNGAQYTLRNMDGDWRSFGVEPGEVLPFKDTHCVRVMDGRLPNVIADMRVDKRTRDMPITKSTDMGSYVSVALHLGNGEFYGTLCCASHSASTRLDQRDAGFLSALGSVLASAIDHEQAQADAHHAHDQDQTAVVLLKALQARDHYTASHSAAVVELAHHIAVALGLSESERVEIRHVALLHDVGKVGIPDSILQKEGKLDDLEWQVMREHPAIGARLIAEIDSLSHIAPAIRAEHERWDGNGYPDGLAGEAIPLASRVCLACDAFHAMTSDRPYRKARTIDEAVQELRDNAGTQLDPVVVDALLAVLAAEKPPGSA